MRFAERSAQRALVDAFAPGAPPLPQRLHTLRVTPAERACPGELVLVSLRVSNRGKAVAKNVRVRFLQPAAVAHVEGSDRFDRHPIAPQTLSAPAGAFIGDLAAGSEHDLSCEFRVADRVEDRASLQFQAAVCSGEIPPFASNAVRLVVSGAPALQNARTVVSVLAQEPVQPGDAIRVRVEVHNAGSASAHAVRLLLPQPEHTSYDPGSARLDERMLGAAGDQTFTVMRTIIAAESLPPDASVVFEYEARIEGTIPTRGIYATAAIASNETQYFVIHSQEVSLQTHEFAQDRAIVRRLEPSETAVPFVEFPAAALLQTLRALESEGTTGLRRHLMVLRALVLNTHAPIAKVLENARDRTVLEAMVRQALDPHEPRRREPGPGTVRLSGVVELAALRQREPQLQTAQLGAAATWIVAAQLLGSRIEVGSRQLFSEELVRYRDDLLEVLEVLEALPPGEFRCAIDSAVNRPLDEALGRAIDALRSAALP